MVSSFHRRQHFLEPRTFVNYPVQVFRRQFRRVDVSLQGSDSMLEFHVSLSQVGRCAIGVSRVLDARLLIIGFQFVVKGIVFLGIKLGYRLCNPFMPSTDSRNTMYLLQQT